MQLFFSNKRQNGGPSLEIQRSEPHIKHSKKTILLTSKLTNDRRSQSILILALALIQQHHDVEVITMSPAEIEWEENFQTFACKNMPISLPDDFFGFFKSTFNAIKSIVLALYTVYKRGRYENDVFCDLSTSSIPVLKCFGNFRVMYFNQMDRLNTSNKLVYCLCDFVQKCVQNFNLVFADEIIVPNLAMFRMYNKIFYFCEIPKVLYPCIDTGNMESEECIQIHKIIPRIQNDCYIFLVYGDYLLPTNFKLAIDAFDILYQIKEGQKQAERIMLVVAGNLNQNNKKQLKHYKDLMHYTSVLKSAKNILFFKILMPEMKKTLLANSTAILYTSSDNAYGNEILEAMYIGRPVIAIKNKITLEYLQYNAGFTLYQNAHCFAAAMDIIINDSRLSNVFEINARLSFSKKYSFVQYEKRLKHIMEGNGCFPEDMYALNRDI